MKIAEQILAGNIPVRTRLPLAAWALAAMVTAFSLLSALLHPHLSSQAEASGMSRLSAHAAVPCEKTAKAVLATLWPSAGSR